MSAQAEGGLTAGQPAFRAQALRFASAPGVRIGAKILVSAGLLAWIFHKVQLSEPTARIGGAWEPIFFVWLIQSTLPFVQALRWRLIAATLGARLPFSAAIKNVYIGQFFNQVLPSAIGGDAVRVWKLTRFMPVETALSSVALDRVVALLAVPIILIIGSGMLATIVPDGPLRWALYGMMIAAACGLLSLLWADRIPLPEVLLRSRLVAVIRAMPLAARRLFSNPACLLRATCLSIVIHAGVGTSLWVLARNYDADAPLAAFLVLAPLVTMVTTIPISVGGWGVREGAMITALGLVGIAPSIALTVSIQFGLIMLVVGLPGGVLAFFDRDRSTSADRYPPGNASATR